MRIISNSLLLILIFAGAHLPAAEECSTKDFTSQVGPVRNQGSKGWCFAYATADLLTQKLRRMNPKEFSDYQVSAVDVTFQYMKNRPTGEVTPITDSAYWDEQVSKREQAKKRDREIDVANAGTFDKFAGGFIDLAIATYPNDSRGFCSEKDLPSQDGVNQEILNSVNAEVDQSIKACGLRADQVKNLKDLRNRCWEDTIERKCHRLVKSFPKKLKSVDGWVHQATLNTDGTLSFTMKDEDGRQQDYTTGERQELRKLLNEGLDHGSIVGIGITPAFLMNEAARRDIGKDNRWHEVSIVARKKMGSECFYQIRNSWGESCERYTDKYQAQCMPKGYVWVSERDLLPHMTRAHYLE